MNLTCILIERQKSKSLRRYKNTQRSLIKNFITSDSSWKTNMNFSKLLLKGIELKETQESHKELYLIVKCKSHLSQ